jgi:hypothetical protein
MRAFIVVAMILVAGQSCTSPRSSATEDESRVPTDVTLCDLAKNAETFDGRTVSVTAIVTSTAHYGMTASDPRCESDTLAVVIPSTLDGDRAIENFRTMVFEGFPRRRERVEAHLTGEFRSRSDVPTRLLWIHRVEVVTK